MGLSRNIETIKKYFAVFQWKLEDLYAGNNSKVEKISQIVKLGCLMNYLQKLVKHFNSFLKGTGDNPN